MADWTAKSALQKSALDRRHGNENGDLHENIDGRGYEGECHRYWWGG